MEYSIDRLARLSGVSTRTLRYYDQIGLLCPARISNGYRIYGRKEVDLLQQILFYRELGVPLAEIGRILRSPDADREAMLTSHLLALQHKKYQIELMIGNVSKTISAMKGEITMTDQEKFAGLKDEMIDSNEKKYGEEIRRRYGDAVVDASNARVRGMSEATWKHAQELQAEIAEKLQAACAEGNPESPLAREVCELHKEWLCLFWPEGMYTAEAHAALAESYVTDERFRAYYDKMAAGCAEFLRDAICAWCR